MREGIILSKFTELHPSTWDATPARRIACVREASPAEATLGSVSTGMEEFLGQEERFLGFTEGLNFGGH